MKIVVIGGSGLIGSKLVTKLRERRHETLAASPASGVNTLTGQGLAAALESAAVVADVSNSPSFEGGGAGVLPGKPGQNVISGLIEVSTPSPSVRSRMCPTTSSLVKSTISSAPYVRASSCRSGTDSTPMISRPDQTALRARATVTSSPGGE